MGKDAQAAERCEQEREEGGSDGLDGVDELDRAAVEAMDDAVGNGGGREEVEERHEEDVTDGDDNGSGSHRLSLSRFIESRSKERLNVVSVKRGVMGEDKVVEGGEDGEGEG